MYEWQLIESEQKWNPIKVYEKNFNAEQKTKELGSWKLNINPGMETCIRWMEYHLL